MRYLILSDIHANLAAFDAVLADVGHFDKIWCLGDMVGYGPQPNECIERLCEFPHICIAGNHDWAALDKLSDSDFNPDAQWACRWTREQLLPENFEYLDNLPVTLLEEGFTLVHGSPRSPYGNTSFILRLPRPILPTLIHKSASSGTRTHL